MSAMHQTFDAKAEECFEFLDINKDGTLSVEELWKGFEKLKIPPPSREDFCKEVHLRENKRVTKEDFKEYTEKQYQKVKDLFNALDLKKDGKITSDEIVEAVKKYDPNIEVQESDITRLFLKVDRDHDGSVNFEEWCEFLILIPNLTIKTVINYWRQVIQLTDDFTLYGIHRNPPLPEYKKHTELKNWLASFSAGMFAGVVSRTSMAPLDRLKLIYQVYYKAGQSPPSIATGLKELYKRDGFKGLFRGNLMTISRAGPETSLKLTIFEKLKSVLPLQTDGKPSKGGLFIAGSIAGVIANIITFPLGVLRTRLAAAPSGTYNGVIDAVTKMRKNEGAIKPFYRGLTPALMAIVPNSGLNLMSYEVLKRFFIKKTANKEPSPIIFMVMGGLSALFSNTLLYPLQITTSRMVMQGLLEGQKKKGMVEVMKGTYQSEGYLGFYKGYRAAITKIMLGNAISFGCFEFMKRTFGVDFRKRR